MIRKVVCPQCQHRGVKEYKAFNYARPRMPGKGRKAEPKRSCPNCQHSWFYKWDKENADRKATA